MISGVHCEAVSALCVPKRNFPRRFFKKKNILPETVMNRLPDIEDTGYHFKTADILKEALTHRSFSTEHGLSFDNQRLEFLGDAVIQLIVTEYLYKKYPAFQEGKLTKTRAFLTQRNSLAKFAKQIKLGNFIRTGRGELKAKGTEKESILCDAFEALCAAIYLDGGMRAAENFIIPLIDNLYPSLEIVESEFNPKGFLQELTQSKHKTKPVYKLEETNGQDHCKVFTVSVFINGKIMGTAVSATKKGAEAEAATKAIEIISKDNTALNPEKEKD
jgi:ribonuclease III